MLARRLGDQAFGEAASSMAAAAAAAGSPLDTALRALGGAHASILPAASPEPSGGRLMGHMPLSLTYNTGFLHEQSSSGQSCLSQGLKEAA